MNIEIGREARITGCQASTFAEIRKGLTFQNPAYEENVRHGFSNWNTPSEITCFEQVQGALVIPRGFTGQAIRIGKGNGEKVSIQDNRRKLLDVDFQFNGELRPFQVRAVEDVLRKDFGTLQSPTGSGKTTMALYVIAARKQPALVVVHSKELLQQWADRIETFLQIPRAEIGVIGSGKKRIGSRITVALVQSLYKVADEVAQKIGFLIIDECHRCPSKTFLEAVTAFNSQYMLGLSATPWRRDNLTRLIWFYLGDRVHQVDGEHLVDAGHICRAVVEQVETDFDTDIDGSEEYSRLLSALCTDPERNALVARHTAAEAEAPGGVVLVLSDRKSHCESIRRALAGSGIQVDMLTGDVGKKDREELSGRLRAGSVKVLVATGQLIGEGFDLPEISSVLLATPLKFSGRLIQYIGRALRPAPGKDKARILDFVDSRVGVLKAGAKSRMRTYQQLPGIEVK